MKIQQESEKDFCHNKNIDNKLGDLTHSQVLTMREDPSGRLWIGTRGDGIYLFDSASGKVAHYIHEKLKLSGL